MNLVPGFSPGLNFARQEGHTYIPETIDRCLTHVVFPHRPQCMFVGELHI